MLCYSTGSLPDAASVSDIIDLLAPTPFRGVEFVLTAAMLPHAEDAGYWKTVREQFAEAGLCVRNVHLGSPHLCGPEAHRPGLATLDDKARAEKFRVAGKALRIAAWLGSPHLTLTTGLPDAESPDPTVTSMLRARQTEALRGELARLVAAKPRGLDLLIEQEPEHVIRETAQLIDLCEEFPGDVFANFDVGHSHVMGEDIPACIRALGPRLRNVHLEDIRGRVHRHHLFGDGDIDFDAVFRSLQVTGYHGDYTPDLYPFKDEAPRALAASEAFLRRHGVLTPAL